jgi:hypothetical protein
MTAAIATPTTSNVLPVSSTQEIPLARICEAKTNPRRQFDETKLAELPTISAFTGNPGDGVPKIVTVPPAGLKDAFATIWTFLWGE